MNLSHEASGSEIPELIVTGDAEVDAGTEETTSEKDDSDLVLACLEEASGESLTAEEIAEQTELEHNVVRRICKSLSRVDANLRCVHRDEDQRGSFFWAPAIVDRIHLSLT